MRRGTALLICLAAAPGLASCGGGDEDPASTAVKDYIREANVVQQRARPALETAQKRYEAFAKGKLKGEKAELELRESEIALAGARRRVAAVEAPAPARELRRRLLRTYDLTVALAAETRQVAVYTPRARAALLRLQRVRRGLRDRLRGSRDPGRQVAALKRYARRLDAVRTTLTALEVPAVLAPTQTEQVERLVRTRSLARQLAAAIEKRDAGGTARLLKAFRGAGDASPLADRLARGAVIAYGQRLTVLARAGGDVTREQARLLAPDRG